MYVSLSDNDGSEQDDTLPSISIQSLSLSDNDGSQQDDTLPSISIESQSLNNQSKGLQFHSRSSSTIPVNMNKMNTVLRISFSWITGHEDSRMVIKVVKESEVLFEIEDWTYNPSHTSIERYYNSSHDHIKNLKKGCHFELHYAVGGNRGLEIKDFMLRVEGKLIGDIA